MSCLSSRLIICWIARQSRLLPSPAHSTRQAEGGVSCASAGGARPRPSPGPGSPNGCGRKSLTSCLPCPCNADGSADPIKPGLRPAYKRGLSAAVELELLVPSLATKNAGTFHLQRRRLLGGLDLNSATIPAGVTVDDRRRHGRAASMAQRHRQCGRPGLRQRAGGPLMSMRSRPMPTRPTSCGGPSTSRAFSRASPTARPAPTSSWPRSRPAGASTSAVGLLHHAVRAAAGLDGDAERPHRDRRAVAQPQRGAADHEFAAHHLRGAARRLDGCGTARPHRGATAPGLEP